LARMFDTYSEDVSTKTKLMNVNAAVVYYAESSVTQEFKDKGFSLEDKTPTRQSMQYQYRNEFLSAVDNLQSELKYLDQNKGESDFADLKEFSGDAVAALSAYIGLAPPAQQKELDYTPPRRK